MALYQSRLQSLKVHSAVETAFGVAEASFTGRDIQLVSDCNLDLKYNMIPDPSLHQKIFPYKAHVMGLQSGSKMTFQTPFRGTGTAAASTIAAKGADDLAEGQLLKNALGGESLGTGTVCGLSSTTTSIVVANSAIFAVGQAVLINGEASPIGAIPDGTHITLKRALSTAPAQNAVINASATYYPDADYFDSGITSLQFQARSPADEYWQMYGVQANLALVDIGPGQYPKLSWDCHVTAFAKAASGAMAAASYDKSIIPPIPGNASKMYIQTLATTTINTINTNAFSINLNSALVPFSSVSGIQGVSQYVREKIEPAFEITIPYDDDYVDAFNASTAKYLHYQIGSTAGNTILIEIPNWYVENNPDRAAIGTLLGHKFKGYAIQDTTTTNDLTLAPVRIHLL
jgi:hypothetical protein